MTVYCVSYDLNKTGQNYNGLYKELEKSSGYWHYLDSTWLIATSETATQLFARLKAYVDDNDSMLVIRVTTEHSGWLPKKAWDWINNNV
ncbi:hypothetical protein [Psychromonas aquimarina]|uniref:hypothetical protein n=1 Tax=Psychromonas aquimarina TaxID=444919 RepID=UPI00049110CE|nr:hypothetical protein [Psychromonas aquimarina]